MNLADAEKLALELMREFKLIDPQRKHGLPQFSRDWRFEFDNAKRRFGCCHRTDLKITLSRELVKRNDREQVEDTIRHEIAHALAPSRSGHGPAWKEMCARTGANPERFYDETVDTPKGDWTATCGGCGREHHKFRKPRGERFCAAKDCRMKNPPEYGQGRFNLICKLVWRHKNALPEAVPNAEMHRKAIEAMKAQLRAAEQEPGAEC